MGEVHSDMGVVLSMVYFWIKGQFKIKYRAGEGGSVVREAGKEKGK
jgi:hypothetical protein